MNQKKELRDFVKKDKALHREIELAQWKVTSSQMEWTKLAIDIVDIQMLILVEDSELEKRLRQIGAELPTYNLTENCKLNSPMRQLIASYERMLNNVKWTKFRKRLNHANAAFDQAKTVWDKLTQDFTISMALEEIRKKIRICETSKRIAASWASKYEGLMNDWENIKRSLEEGIQDCAQLAAIYKKTTEEPSVI